MYIQKIKDFTKKLFTGNLSNKEKTLVTISLLWMIITGYLTWWNGLKNPGIDKSFRWDEWVWFGIVPATVPYLFYFIWAGTKNKDSDDLSNKDLEK